MWNCREKVAHTKMIEMIVVYDHNIGFVEIKEYSLYGDDIDVIIVQNW